MVQVDVTLSDSRINTIVGYSICFKLSYCDSFQAIYTPDGISPSESNVMFPSLISDNAEVSGEITLYSSANCGTRYFAPPRSFIEWQDDNGFLASWTASSPGILGSGDAWCILASDSSVSSPVQQQIQDHGGSHNCDVKIYTGSHSSGSRPVVGTCAGTSFCTPLRNPNQVWIDATFSGGGVLTNKFAKDSLTISGYLGSRPTINAAAAGVVNVTADDVTYDCFFKIFRNSTSVFSMGDSGCNGGAASVSTTFAVSVGDVITLGDPDDYNVCTNLQIWWTAT